MSDKSLSTQICPGDLKTLPQASLILDNLYQRKIITLNDIETSIQIQLLNPKSSTSRSSTNDVSNDRIPASSLKQTSKRKKNGFIERARHVALLISYQGYSHSGFTTQNAITTKFNPASTPAPTSTSNYPNNIPNHIPPSSSNTTSNINLTNDNSVEYHLFQALQKSNFITHPSNCHYARCGRTDKGVSAHGQVISLYVRSAIPSHVHDSKLPSNSHDTISISIPLSVPSSNKTMSTSTTDNQTLSKTYKELNYPKILNHHLPSTIRVLGWCPVDAQFSARYSTIHRQYRYYFTRTKSFDLAQMQSALDNLVGTHDFRNMCKFHVKEVQHFERTIDEAKVVLLPNSNHPNHNHNHNNSDKHNNDNATSKTSTSSQIGYIHIKGNAFLHHQIRYITQLLFLIGKRFESTNLISQLLDIASHPCKPNYTPASDFPLVLQTCVYHRLKFGYTVENLWHVMQGWHKKWQMYIIQAQQIKDGMDALCQDARVTLGDVKDFYHRNIIQKRQSKQIKRAKQTKRSKHDSNLSSAISQSTLEWLPHDLPHESNHHVMTWREAFDILSPIMEQEEQFNHVPIMERVKANSLEERLHKYHHKHTHNTTTKIATTQTMHNKDIDDMQIQSNPNTDSANINDESKQDRSGIVGSSDEFYSLMRRQGGSAGYY